MPSYLFVYHGGTAPASEEDQQTEIAAWHHWLEGLGGDVVDGGNPVGVSSTLHADGSVTPDGGANPASGYGVFTAKDLDDALARAKGCPHLASGGTIEVAEIFAIEAH